MLSAIRHLHRRNQDIDINKFPAVVTAHFQQQYFSENAFNSIPVLNLDNPPESFVDGSFVAFSAMVQDTSLSPELYLAKTSDGDCGGWGLSSASQGENVQYNNLRECSVFWAVSIPGLSPWCPSSTSLRPASFRAILPHKYPIPEVPHVGVQLKIYDEALSRPLRVTDLACFVGILMSESFHSNLDSSEHLSVPTLHVLFAKSLSTTVLPRVFPDTSILSSVRQLRGELIHWIADEALEGDLVAAEWVLLAAISRVQSRNPPVLPLSLTLSGFPSSLEANTTPTLHHVLSLIFPLVTTLPLSLSALNKTSFCPESKDEDLHSGWLQHPKGAVAVFNEGNVTEGEISSKGVMNIRAAQKMMETQVLDYLFPFSGFQFETDVNFIVMTIGKQSTFFKTDLNISLNPKTSTTPNEEARRRLYRPLTDVFLPPSEKLTLFRRLVGGAKVGNVAVGEETGKHIEEDFVKERSNNIGANGYTSDDLIRRMLVSRLVSLSFHEPEVTVESWEHTKRIETIIRR